MEQLDRGECSRLDAEEIIAEERRRKRSGEAKPE
jgi:hypothetical protein